MCLCSSASILKKRHWVSFCFILHFGFASIHDSYPQTHSCQSPSASEHGECEKVGESVGSFWFVAVLIGSVTFCVSVDELIVNVQLFAQFCFVYFSHRCVFFFLASRFSSEIAIEKTKSTPEEGETGVWWGMGAAFASKLFDIWKFLRSCFCGSLCVA